MTDIVERIKVSDWLADGGEQRTTYWITLVNETGQREVPCYDPRGRDLKEDTSLPEGWEVKTSKAGKPYLAAPRATSGGGGTGLVRSGAPAAWRNTEAGAKYEDERVDRRRALEQAIAMNYPAETPFGHILTVAGELYAWLRESVSASSGGDRALLATPAGSLKAGAGEADTPSDEGGGTEYGSTVTASQDSPPPSSSKRLANEPPPGWDATKRWNP